MNDNEPVNMSEHPAFVKERQQFSAIIDEPGLNFQDYTDVSFADFCDMQSWGTISHVGNISISEAPMIFHQVAGCSVSLEHSIKLWLKQNPEAAKALLS